MALTPPSGYTYVRGVAGCWSLYKNSAGFHKLTQHCANVNGYAYYTRIFSGAYNAYVNVCVGYNQWLSLGQASEFQTTAFKSENQGCIVKSSPYYF